MSHGYDAGVGDCEGAGGSVEWYFPDDLSKHPHVPDCKTLILSCGHHVSAVTFDVYAPDGPAVGKNLDKGFVSRTAGISVFAPCSTSAAAAIW